MRSFGEHARKQREKPTRRWLNRGRSVISMVPMYAARVEHLTHHETVTALCAACGHVAEVPVAELWHRLPRYKCVADIKLRCARCGERERVELDASKALGNDRLP